MKAKCVSGECPKNGIPVEVVKPQFNSKSLISQCPEPGCGHMLQEIKEPNQFRKGQEKRSKLKRR